MLWQIVGLSALGSIGGLLGGILLALRKKPFSHETSLLMVSFAAGVMLATAFLDILPETGVITWWAVLSGTIFLFLLEKSLIWYHHHGDDCNGSYVPALITLGDTLHNFIDGVVMGATFLASPATGLITALAIMAHEIPHEMADFGVMLSLGWNRLKVILTNLLSSLVSILGAVGVYYFGVSTYLPLLLSFAGGMFIYLACSDLIPELHHAHKKAPVTNNFLQVVVFGLGIALIPIMQKALEGLLA
jgi:zinc and cadmium transporter